MSGHSKWSKIKRQKAGNDAKRGAQFTKIGNAIAVAAKNGTDPDTNFALRLAIDKAKAANMPNANIEKSIKRGSGQSEGEIINEYLFEGYGPKGIGIIVEAASDNRNRTSTEVKTAFSKNGGNLAETGSVAFQFSRKGVIRVKVSGDKDELTLDLIDAGAEDVNDDGEELVVYTEMRDLHKVRTALGEKGIEIVDAELQYVPGELILVEDGDTAKKVIKLMDALEELDDVTNTFGNFDIDESLVEQ